MTALPADKLDAVLAGVLRMEAVLTGLDGRAGGIAAQATRVDAQLHRLEVEVAALKRVVGRLPSKTLLVILLLATAGVVQVFGL